MNTVRRAHTRLMALAMLVLAVLAFSAGAADAAPSEPILTLDQLQSRLDASGGTLDGHLKTVLKGSTIVDIPVRVLAVTAGNPSGPVSVSAFIVFEAHGATIDALGGIASGMSGSPVYVDDGGTDKLVGALSYGDSMTLGGTGLATPIEAMSLIEAEQGFRPVTIQSLDEPVLTAGGLKDRVIITSNPEDHAPEAAAGAIVAGPLAQVYLGGVDPQSRIYQEYAAFLEKRGVRLTSSGMSGMTSPYSAPFQPGSAIASLASRGDMWAGAVGTVTYVNAGNVLAFGHPMYWTGATNLYMANAWIDHTWPSDFAPYKVARPAALRGTITQDRAAGILGVDGPLPTDIPITAVATNADTGQTAETTVTMPARVIDSSSATFRGLPTLAVYVAGSRVFDQSSVIGSAHTTTTVSVSDGVRTYEIKRRNIVDSQDVLYSAVADVDAIVTALQDVGANGIATPHIKSVKLESSISAARQLAEVIGVNAPSGLRHGTNRIVVSYLAFGNRNAQTSDVMLTIPANVPLSGVLSAYSIDGPPNGDEDGSPQGELLFDDVEDPAPSQSVDRTTVGEIVDELRRAPANGELTVTFQPVDASYDPENEAAVPPKAYAPVSARSSLDAYLVGAAMMQAPAIDAALSPGSTVGYKGSARVIGTLLGAEGSTGTVKITRQYAGESAVVSVATVPIDDEGTFSAPLSGLRKNATIRLTYSGDADTLPVSTTLNAKVKAKVSLKRSASKIKRGKRVTLKATVSPGDTNGKVVFERYSGGRWKAIATRTLGGGTALYKYKAPLGTNKLRARTVGSTRNAAGKSSVVVVKVVR